MIKTCGSASRSWHGTAALLVLAVALTSLQICTARSYLGCFDAQKWQYSYKGYSSNWTVETCSAKCEELAFPLVGLAELDTACMCSTYTPNGANQLGDELCEGKVSGAMALYYYKIPSRSLSAPAPTQLDRTWPYGVLSTRNMIFLLASNTARCESFG
jgi:hypothetical protein